MLAVSCSTVGGLIALTLWNMKEFREKHIRVLMMKQIFESIFVYSMFAPTLICQFEQYKLFSMTFYMTLDVDHFLKSAYHLLFFDVKYILSNSITVMLNLHFYFNMELALMLRSPFKISQTRTFDYIFLAQFIIQLIVNIILLERERYHEFYRTQGAMVVILIISSVLSNLYCMFKLRKMSFCQNESKRILYKRVLSQVAWLVCNTFFLFSYLFVFVDGERVKDFRKSMMDHPPIWLITLKMLFVTQGIIMTVVRFFDPFLLSTLKQKIKDSWNKEEKEREDRENE